MSRIGNLPSGDQRRVATVEEVLALISAPKCYIDTARFLVVEPLSYEDRHTLERASGRPLVYHKVKSERVAYHYQRALQFSQPSLKLLRVLADVLPEHVVSRLDVALDLPTEGRRQAKRVQRFMAQYLIQLWHSTDGIFSYGKAGTATLYWTRKEARRQLLVYSDKPSKITGEPCCHVEVRFIGTKQVRGQGISTVDDLITTKPEAIIAPQLQFREVSNPLAFDAAIEGSILRNADREHRAHKREVFGKFEGALLPSTVRVIPGVNLLRWRRRHVLAEKLFGEEYDRWPAPWHRGRVQDLMDFCERAYAVRKFFTPLAVKFIGAGPLINRPNDKPIETNRKSANAKGNGKQARNGHTEDQSTKVPSHKTSSPDPSLPYPPRRGSRMFPAQSKFFLPSDV